MEENFFKLLSVLAKGTLYEQFNLCLDIVCPKYDVIKQDQFRSTLDILYRIAFTANTPYEICSQRMDTYVENMFSQFPDKSLPRTDIKDTITKAFPLEELWTHLFIQDN